ncbi:hypothetical protein QN219_27240 [Sinorhizobium sp. 7-81]|uniref:hypothetical protein n=1 Tax=Sinorhizobium sp. 8-89 TaxID=3049089 RepID=UPI0024C3BEC9|nr:hypothetical protein [Sinorhizobium sp. 8-89]MDK1493691.1 hypothetical protein [Sinorhizobium sp. 8-89]
MASTRGLTTLRPVLVARPVCKDHLSAEIVRQLNHFGDHINHLFGTPDRPGGPERARWATLADHDAAVQAQDRMAHTNRPLGTITGMIQSKHASVAAFEGYAGSGRSDF